MSDPRPSLGERLRSALKHAFHVEPPGIAVPAPEEEKLLRRMIDEVVSRGMAQPALLFLESLRPLNGVGAQAMHFLHPFASVIVQPRAYERIAAFLERRGSIEWICRAIEDADAACDAGNSRRGGGRRASGSDGGIGASGPGDAGG
jgi:hypothetical protein